VTIIADTEFDLAVFKSTTSILNPSDTMAEAGRKVLRGDFIKMLENEAGSRIGEDIEHVHDMRVATRRMRSTFRLLGDYYKGGTIQPFVDYVRLIARRLGAIRDLDVMVTNLEKFAQTADAETQETINSAVEKLDKARRKARKRLVALLDSDDYAEFVTSFAKFLDKPGRGVKNSVKNTNSNHVVPSEVRHVLPALVHEHLATVRAYDTVIEEASLEQLHDLRIEFKRLRYLVSHFSDVLGASVSGFIDELKHIQDYLGELNDNVVAAGQLSSLFKNNDALDSYIAQLETDTQQRVDGFPEVWEKFNKRTVQRKLSDSLLVLR